MEEAERWVEERRLSEEDDISYPRESDYLVLARVFLARSDPARALGLLERLDALAEAQGRKESLIGSEACGPWRCTRPVITEAPSPCWPRRSLARWEGYVRVFADDGPPLAGLLQSYVRAAQRGRVAALSGAARQHLNRVVRAFGPPAGQAEKAAPAGPG